MIYLAFERSDVALAAFDCKAGLIRRGRICQISRCTSRIGLCTICASRKQPVAFLLAPPTSFACFPSDTTRHLSTRKAKVNLCCSDLARFCTLWASRVSDSASPHLTNVRRPSSAALLHLELYFTSSPQLRDLPHLGLSNVAKHQVYPAEYRSERFRRREIVEISWGPLSCADMSVKLWPSMCLSSEKILSNMLGRGMSDTSCPGTQYRGSSVSSGSPDDHVGSKRVLWLGVWSTGQGSS